METHLALLSMHRCHRFWSLDDWTCSTRRVSKNPKGDFGRVLQKDRSSHSGTMRNSWPTSLRRSERAVVIRSYMITTDSFYSLLSRDVVPLSHASSCPGEINVVFKPEIISSASCDILFTRSSHEGMSSMSPTEIPALFICSVDHRRKADERKTKRTTRLQHRRHRSHTPSYPWLLLRVLAGLRILRLRASVRVSQPLRRQHSCRLERCFPESYRPISRESSYKRVFTGICGLYLSLWRRQSSP